MALLVGSNSAIMPYAGPTYEGPSKLTTRDRTQTSGPATALPTTYSLQANERSAQNGAVTVIDKKIYIMVDGVWRQATPWINVNGVWKQATPWINVDGVWK